MRLSVRDPLSRRTIEDLLHERGIEVSHETLRVWWRRSGRIVADEIRWTRRARLRSLPRWLWHLDTAFVKINGATPCSVAHDGDALKSLAKTMKRHGNPHSFVTDTFRSCSAAVTDLGLPDGRVTCLWRDKLAENSAQHVQRPLPPDAIAPEMRRSFFLLTHHGHCQLRPHRQEHCRGQPHRCPRQRAPTLRGQTPGGFGQTETE